MIAKSEASPEFNGSFLAMNQCGGSERKTPVATECKPGFAGVAGFAGLQRDERA